MEGERERLNHRITALTDQLATAAPDPRLEMLHVRTHSKKNKETIVISGPDVFNNLTHYSTSNFLFNLL